MRPVLAIENDLRRLVRTPTNRSRVQLERWAIHLALALVCAAVSGGSFARSPGFSAVAAPHGEALVDLDGDRILDHVLIGHGTGGSKIDIALSQLGSASLNLRRATVHRVTGFDIDADGDLDLVASTDAGLAVWKNTGRGQFIRVRESGRSPPPGPFWSANPGTSLRMSGWLPRTDPLLRRVRCGVRRPDSATRRLVVSPHRRSHSPFTCRCLRAPPAASRLGSSNFA